MSSFIRRKENKIESEKKIIIIDHEKCKPKTPSYDYLVSKSRSCGKECIVCINNKIIISEDACMVCFNIAKRTPGNAISVVKLPTNLTTNITHCYGSNSFKLHGLPLPNSGSVLGLLGTNGIGKSTAINILSGKINPNFGNYKNVPTQKDILNYYRGSDLQNYFNKLFKKKLKISIKPQNIVEYSKNFYDLSVINLLKKYNQQNKLNYISEKLQLTHLYDRPIQLLSGGELQRLFIAITVLIDADVYLFDESSSYLDVKQRIIATDIIRSLIDPNEWDNNEKVTSRYIIVVEHDLSVLDYMSDNIQFIYGKPGVYGVISSKLSVSNGINQFMEGYIKTDNIKFRQYQLTFKNNSEQDIKKITNSITTNYPCMEKSYDDTKFKITIKEGYFNSGEIICLMGENGVGKSTFMDLLAYNFINNKILIGFSISYKTQNIDIDIKKFNGTVQDLLEQKINKALSNKYFKLFVLTPLKIDLLNDLKVNTLSGGEIQRLAITICLGTPASVYLIDEPSAGLDCEQRVIVSKVIKKWIVEHLDKSCFLIEHDFLMTSNIADKIILFEGIPGVECFANSPVNISLGFNSFLKNLNITFRRDIFNYRPRINKKNSTKDKEQKLNQKYFIFDDI